MYECMWEMEWVAVKLNLMLYALDSYCLFQNVNFSSIQLEVDVECWDETQNSMICGSPNLRIKCFKGYFVRRDN